MGNMKKLGTDRDPGPSRAAKSEILTERMKRACAPETAQRSAWLENAGVIKISRQYWSYSPCLAMDRRSSCRQPLARHYLRLGDGMDTPLRAVALIVVSAFLAGCAMWDRAAETVERDRNNQYRRAETETLLRARKVGRGYQPIDPITVQLTANLTNQEILDALPNEAMRLAVGQLDSSGNVTFGPAAVGFKDSNYLVIIDYIKYQSRSILLRYKLFDVEGCEQKTKNASDEKRGEVVRAICEFEYQALGVDRSVTEAEAAVTEATPPKLALDSLKRRGDLQPLAKWNYTYIPLYMGLGVRMMAAITVIEGKVNLSSPIGLGAAAQANQISGGLMVQTLGASGSGISSAIPIPSELNATTIQNAIMALGTVKSKLYDEKNVLVSPQIVGVDDFVASQASKDAIVSGVYRFLPQLQFNPAVKK
jgi:hypothetical protein